MIALKKNVLNIYDKRVVMGNITVYRYNLIQLLICDLHFHYYVLDINNKYKNVKG